MDLGDTKLAAGQRRYAKPIGLQLGGFQGQSL